MAADMSRVRFDAFRDHSGVVLQQGRLLLDADWNELVAVIDRRLRAGAADLGSEGPEPGIAGVAVVSRTTPDAFLVSATSGAITIGRGRMYVDGLLAENHGTGDLAFDALLSESRRTGDTPYDKQPYWRTPVPLPTTGTHLVYLDVWPREVTALEAPDLVEQAVGVDTTARIQMVWQVRCHAPDTPGISCSTDDDGITGWTDVIAPSAGRLTTGTVAVADTDDPCELPPTGGYRGRENQTYRVEIHDPGPVGTATFKWSRDNASVASPIVEVISSTKLRPGSLGKDAELRFRTGDWVEILDDDREFDQRAGVLRKIDVHVEDGTITFAPALPADLQMTTAEGAARHLRVRRWDQRGQVKSATGANLDNLDGAGATGAIKVPSGTTRVVLEHGVTVQLRAPNGRFRAGDHWVFAARTGDTSVEQLTDAPPRGVHHHYARLAVVTFPGTESDCRTPWPPVVTGGTDTCGDCTVCVTPESHANGSLTIQDAVDIVRPTGGTVCLSTGVFHLDAETVRIEGAAGTTLRGHGVRTVLVARGAAVEVRRSAFVILKDFAVISAAGRAAIRLEATAAATVQRLTVLVAGAEDVARTGVELGGVSVLTRLRDNVVLAPVGIGSGDAKEGTLLTAALEIAGNVLVSTLAGIAFEGRVAHLLGNTVRANTVLRSTGAGVRALGLVGPGGSFEVAGNTAFVAGAGVEVATGGYCVRDNEITGTAGSLERRGDGVAVLPGTFGSVRGLTRVGGNRVRDVGGTGIAVRAPVGDVDITHNAVERSAAGIVFEERGRAAAVSVTANVVRAVGSRESDAKGSGAVGIQVVGAQRAHIDGNTVVGVGTIPGTGIDAAGVRVLATRESRVSANAVDLIGAPDEGAPRTGIQVAGLFDRTIVLGNDSRRAPDDVDDLAPVAFTGLQVGAGLGREGSATVALGEYVFVPSQAGGFLVGTKTAHAAAAPGRPAKAIIEANSVAGGGEVPAVLIVVAGDVVASGNQCWQPRESATASIDLTADSATVNANRARGGRPSIALRIDPERVAVLGNLTSNGITVNNNPLGGPWAPLNPDGF